jgi:hypothetical protein
LAANLFHGDGALASGTMSALNLLEVASGVALVEGFAGRRFRLDSLRRLAAMVVRAWPCRRWARRSPRRC